MMRTVCERTLSCALTTFLFLPVAPGEQNSPAPSQDYTLGVNSNLVLLPTRVETRGGDTIYGLKADRFIVEDNGVRQSVRVEDSPDSTSLSLVVAVQCGRSAPDEFRKLRGLATMVDGIAGSAPHEVAVVVYGERPYLLSDFSERSEDTRAALSRLKPCGEYHAAAIDAVHYSLNMLRHRKNRYRHAILLIGEQRDHGSTSKLPEVVAELGTTDTVIYAVAFSPTKSEFLRDLRYGPNGPPKSEAPPDYSAHAVSEPVEEPRYVDHPPSFSFPPLFMLAVNGLRQNAASEMTKLSGGEYLSFVTQKGLEQALNRIANQIHNYYLLSFQPESFEKVELHSITVHVAGEPNAVIQTRKSYWSGIR